MTRITRAFAVLALLGSVTGSTAAQAQYYPRGYGGYGWGGWGGAHTAGSAMAYGMGNFAAGAGQYNMETAQARATNAQTAMGVNDYMYQVNARNAQNYYMKQAAKEKKTKTAWNEIQARILDNPTSSDVNSGDALNAILELVTNPAVYGQTLESANQALPGSIVRRIPFVYNAAGFTYSLSELLDRDTVPEVFTRPQFDQIRKSLRPIAAELRKEADEEGLPKTATLKKFRAGLDQAKAALEGATAQFTPQREEGEKYLKALYGLSQMLDSPSYDVYLAAVGKEKTVPLREVLQFMHAFSLRFGLAKTPAEKEIYAQLYGTMSGLRKATNPPVEGFASAAAAPVNPDRRVTDFYGGMHYGNVNPSGVSAPPPAQP